MPDPIIIPDPPPAPGGPGPAPVPLDGGGRDVRCEFCQSKLDRRGRVLERGAKVREFMDAEDTIADLRKQLATEKDAHGATRATLSTTAAELQRFKNRKFGATLT